MARNEARLSVSIWTDDDFLALSPTAQRLFMFLLSQPDLTHDGVIALRERRWSKKAAKLTVDQIRRDLDELSTARFVVVDEDAEELLIRSFIRRDKVYRQPNVLLAAADHLATVTSPAVRAAVAVELARIADSGDVPEGSKTAFDKIVGIAGNPSVNPSPKGSRLRPGDGEGSRKGSRNPSRPDPVESDSHPADVDETAGDKGSEIPSPNPSGKGSQLRPGERGVVTAVTTASPFPGPRAPDPRPHSPSGGRAGARDAAPPARSERPPDRCIEHIDDPDPPSCGRCATARKAAERWDRDQADAAEADAIADAARRSAAARDHAVAVRAAIDACTACGSDGRLSGGVLCHHDPSNATRTHRGAAAARAQLRRPPKEAT